MENWAFLKNERLPAAVVDLDAFDKNLATMAKLAGAKNIRIATKSIRVPELIARALKFGKPFKGLMCYSAEEAHFLAEQGFEDLLVAYPTHQPSDLDALVDIHKRGVKVSLVVDSSDGLRALAAALKSGTESSLPFPVLIELDVSLRLLGGLLHLGVRRSPVRTPIDVAKLLDDALKFPHIKVVGVMAYEAQVAGLGDRNPFKKLINPIAGWVRKLSVRSVAKSRRKISELFKARGLKIEIFNGGGTGSLNFSAAEDCLTEVAAGSGLFCSHLFDYYSNVHFEPAAFFALQAVRSSDPGFVTCQGGGYIGSGEPGWDRVPRPYWPDGLSLVSTEGCGEVQTPLRVPSSVKLLPGDPVVFRHAKAGELAERFNEYCLVSGGKIVSRVKTYRGMGKCFF